MLCLPRTAYILNVSFLFGYHRSSEVRTEQLFRDVICLIRVTVLAVVERWSPVVCKSVSIAASCKQQQSTVQAVHLPPVLSLWILSHSAPCQVHSALVPVGLVLYYACAAASVRLRGLHVRPGAGHGSVCVSSLTAFPWQLIPILLYSFQSVAPIVRSKPQCLISQNCYIEPRCYIL